MLVPLEDASPATCGAKAATLGTLARAGLPVPAGFVVPVDVHRALAADPTRDAPPPPLPAELHEALERALGALGDAPVAVRSSADDEDGAHASAAGQYATLLAVQGADAVADAVRTCWASLWSARATAYRASAQGPGDRPGRRPAMAVLVQRLVDADVAGVLFTPSDAGGVTTIEAAWGLGTGVVGGTVTPDAYRVTADGAVTCTVARKATRTGRAVPGAAAHDVPVPDRHRPTLDDDTARRLARLGRRVADVLGPAQDVEWAVAGGTPWVLQSRPVTAALPASDRPATHPAQPGTLRGTPGSTGTAIGPARVVRGPADFSRVRAGDVLVCPWTDPAWTPLLRVVAGVVTETGGVLAHAAIVARERGIPAVLGVADVTTTLRDGTLVTVDGAAGTVVPHP